MSMLTEDEAEHLLNKSLNNAFAREIQRNSYMKRAHYIGVNAINLVRDYFDYRVTDFVNDVPIDWPLADLDRALNEMKRIKNTYPQKSPN